MRSILLYSTVIWPNFISKSFITVGQDGMGRTVKSGLFEIKYQRISVQNEPRKNKANYYVILFEVRYIYQGVLM